MSNINDSLDPTMNHYTQCLEQPEGFPCICDYLAEQFNNDENEALLDDAMEEQAEN